MGLLSLLTAGNFSKTCSFLSPSLQNGGPLAGAHFGGKMSANCSDDEVQAMLLVMQEHLSSLFTFQKEVFYTIFIRPDIPSLLLGCF